MLLMLFRDLRISPLRTFLTGFSMFMGIITVILSVLTGTIGKAYLKETNEQIYGRESSVHAYVSDLSDASYQQLIKLHSTLNSKYRHSAFSIRPSTSYSIGIVNSAIGNPNNPATVSEAKNAYTVDTLFVSPDYNQVFNLPMTAGRWFLSDEDARFEVVINKAAQKIAENSDAAIISTLSSFNFTRASIVGVVNDAEDTPRAYINAISAAFYLHDTWSSSQLTLYLWNVSNLRSDLIKTGFNDSLVDSTGGIINGITSNQASSAFQDITVALQIGFAVSACLLLFVSSIGLINIGLASMEQRTRELLIRRALGATRFSVASLVLGGVLLLAIVVSAAAILLALLAVYSIPIFLPHDTPISPPLFPVEAAYISVAASVFTAVVGGLVPAIRAARLQPALALR